MLPKFRNGDRVTVDVGLADPQPGVIVAVSGEGLTVHLSGGIAGEGYLPRLEMRQRIRVAGWRQGDRTPPDVIGYRAKRHPRECQARWGQQC